jgi:hypothetical protein
MQAIGSDHPTEKYGHQSSVLDHSGKTRIIHKIFSFGIKLRVTGTGITRIILHGIFQLHPSQAADKLPDAGFSSRRKSDFLFKRRICRQHRGPFY